MLHVDKPSKQFLLASMVLAILINAAPGAFGQGAKAAPATVTLVKNKTALFRIVLGKAPDEKNIVIAGTRLEGQELNARDGGVRCILSKPFMETGQKVWFDDFSITELRADGDAAAPKRVGAVAHEVPLK